MSIAPDDLLSNAKRLCEGNQEWIDNLRASYYLIIPKISINSEIAKRELMIAPILQGVLRSVEARLNLEYPIEIDNYLLTLRAKTLSIMTWRFAPLRLCVR